MATTQLERETNSTEPPADSASVSRTEKTIGFPKSEGKSSESKSSRSRKERTAPTMRNNRVTPKRPKGRWFITVLIATIAIVVGHEIWTQFGQNQAYGLIEGRVLDVRAPWNGTIASIHVQDGQQVKQGELLATINNFEFRNERLRLKHELEIALADLSMRVADVQVQEATKSDAAVRMKLEYFQLLGRLHSERAKMVELESNLKTNQWLFDQDTVPKVELESNRIQFNGQKAVVEELAKALSSMEQNLETRNLETSSKQSASILKPLLLQQSRIESIQAEFDRLGQLECLGEIRAPVQGRVVQRHQFTGELIEKNTIVFEVLEQGSLQAVLYVPQSSADRFTVGEDINVVLPPETSPRVFKIEKFAEQMVVAPKSIERFYNSNQNLVAIHAVPHPDNGFSLEGSSSFWLGAEVRLPRFGARKK